MATFTSKASGLWSATGQTTWNEVGAPAAGDTVTINAGHVVDYDADITHTAAITVYGTLRGSGARVLTLSNVVLTVKAGGAITNTGGIFEIKIGAAHNQASAAVVIGESSGSRATVTGSSTSNYIKFTDGGFLRGGRAAAERLLGRLVLPIDAPSLGGVETLEHLLLAHVEMRRELLDGR